VAQKRKNSVLCRNDWKSSGQDRRPRPARPSGLKGSRFSAVTTTLSPEQIREIVQLGVSDLGESLVQVIAQRIPQLTRISEVAADGRMGTRRGGRPRCGFFFATC